MLKFADAFFVIVFKLDMGVMLLVIGGVESVFFGVARMGVMCIL